MGVWDYNLASVIVSLVLGGCAIGAILARRAVAACNDRVGYSHVGIGVLSATFLFALIICGASTSGNNDATVTFFFDNASQSKTLSRWSYLAFALAWAGIEWDNAAIVGIYLANANRNSVTNYEVFGRKGPAVRALVVFLGFFAMFAGTFLESFALIVIFGAFCLACTVCAFYRACKNVHDYKDDAPVLASILYLVQVICLMLVGALLNAIFLNPTLTATNDVNNVLFYFAFGVTAGVLAVHIGVIAFQTVLLPYVESLASKGYKVV
jgi:hypothetical protein